MNKLIASLIVLLVLTQLSWAQNILITDPDFDQVTNPLDCSTYNDGSVTNFFDGGNSTGVYANNSSDTITICPDPILGSKVTVAFGINAGFAWAVDSTDTLFVFDGIDVNAPLVGGFNSNNYPNGFNTQASFINNPTGCLTLLFISDAVDTADGWLGNITCGNPYQPFDLHMQAFKNGDLNDTLAPADTGYINVCLGDSILFVANPDFMNSSDVTGTGYSQNLSNVNVEWELTDGTIFVGDSIWFIPPARQGYLVTLKVTDAFPSVEYLMAKVRVSTRPTFDGIFVESDSICIGDTTFIIGGVTPADTVGVDPTSTSFQLGGTFAGVTYLPDGSGSNYSTDVAITGFTPGDTVSAVTDIEQLCVTLEHSYLGDLEMWLECPDGTTVTIFNSYSPGSVPGGFNGGNTYLGDALDNSIGSPGTGWEYCFSSTNATWGNMATEYGNGNTVPTTISGGSAMNPNGVYLPEQTFADFIGCPINGDWTIHVRDNLSWDDGYIFEWGIYFDPIINPNNESYAPVIVGDFWSSTSPNIIDSTANDTLINIVGQTQGTDLFTYTVEDDFGCFYDTTVTVVISPQPVLQMTIFGSPTSCPGDSVNISTIGTSAIPPYNYVWSTGVAGQTTTAIAAFPVTDSLFIVTLTDWCNTQTVDTAVISVPVSLMSSTSTLDSVYCPGTSVNFDLNITGGATPYVFDWSNGVSTETASGSPNTTTLYQLTVTDQCSKTRVDTATVYVPLFDPINVATVSGGAIICIGDGRRFTAIVTDGATHTPYSYSWSHNAFVTDTFITVSIVQDTTVMVTVTDGCGNSDVASFSNLLSVYDDVSATSSIYNYIICESDTIESEAIVSGGTGVYTYNWTGSGVIFSETELTSMLAPTDQLGYDFVAIDECGLTDTLHIDVEFEDCSVIAPLIFTPNGDQYNQLLHFTNLEKWPYNHLIIYDRWGRKLYDDNYNNNWNGDNHNDGVYYYVLTLADAEDPITGFFHIAR